MSTHQPQNNASFYRALICSAAGWSGAHEAYAGNILLFFIRYAIAMALGPVCVAFDNFIPIALLIAFCSIESIVILHGSQDAQNVPLPKRLLIYLLAAIGCYIALGVVLATVGYMPLGA